ncbi:MAG: class I SAM-dependent methyltransferase [Bacteroidetes bacterium]|jgi:ubiquinone/menaquinone biosynthesis C-methylase UbiE|nr:class I SAM-dependent methyltransferase [Bacteroidota bacterium]
MELQQEQIREQQKQAWNKVSSGWKKWDGFIMEFLRPMGDAIIDKLQVKEDDIVLDIAAGTGEPGLTIAAITKNGRVTGTDLAGDMLKIAEANALAKGLKNYNTKTADVCELPFEANTFTKISCRMGFMFFPDMQLAANEMYRVLKPGGRLAIAVWAGPDKNIWYTAMASVMNKYIETPPSAPDAPGMFRCAAPRVMTSVFAQAGFKHVGEQELTGKVDFVDADTYWRNRTELSETLVAALAKLDDAKVAAIKNEVYAIINANSVNGHAPLDWGINIIYAEK